jgi:hypothetical protein
MSIHISDCHISHMLADMVKKNIRGRMFILEYMPGRIQPKCIPQISKLQHRHFRLYAWFAEKIWMKQLLYFILAGKISHITIHKTHMNSEIHNITCLCKIQISQNTATNQNYIHDEIKSTNKQTIGMLPSTSESPAFHRLSKDNKIKIYWTIILHHDLYGCKTWSLTLHTGHKWRCLRTRCWREYLGL